MLSRDAVVIIIITTLWLSLAMPLLLLPSYCYHLRCKLIGILVEVVAVVGSYISSGRSSSVVVVV